MRRSRLLGGLALLIATLVGSVLVAAPTAQAAEGTPTAADDAYVAESYFSVVAPGVLGNDVGVPGGGPLTVDALSVVPPADVLDFQMQPDGTFFVLPGPGFTQGTTSFTYRAKQTVDGVEVLSEPATVTLGVNTPVAVPDAYTGSPTGVVSVGGPGILANDLAPGGGPLVVDLASVVPPAQGIDFQIQPDGSFFFLGGPGFTGSTSFTYRAAQPGGEGAVLSEPTTVTLTIPTPQPTTLTMNPLLVRLTPLLNVFVGPVSGRLTGPDGNGIAGQTLTFNGGTPYACSAVTDGSGTAVCNPGLGNLLGLILGGKVTGSFAGSPTWLPSSGSAGLIG